MDNPYFIYIYIYIYIYLFLPIYNHKNINVTEMLVIAKNQWCANWKNVFWFLCHIARIHNAQFIGHFLSLFYKSKYSIKYIFIEYESFNLLLHTMVSLSNWWKLNLVACPQNNPLHVYLQLRIVSHGSCYVVSISYFQESIIDKCCFLNVFRCNWYWI